MGLTLSHAPSGPPPRVHVLVHLFVDHIGLFIVRLVCCSSEETVLIIRILELLRVDVRLFASSRLGLPMDSFRTRCSRGQRTDDTHATASADGPSRAGPISDRVVKPEALKDACERLIRTSKEHYSPTTQTGYIRGRRWHRQESQLVGFVARHGCSRVEQAWTERR